MEGEGAWVSEGVGRSRRQVYYIGELFVLTPENNKGTEGGECGVPTINRHHLGPAITQRRLT